MFLDYRLLCSPMCKNMLSLLHLFFISSQYKSFQRKSTEFNCDDFVNLISGSESVSISCLMREKESSSSHDIMAVKERHRPQLEFLYKCQVRRSSEEHWLPCSRDLIHVMHRNLVIIPTYRERPIVCGNFDYYHRELWRLGINRILYPVINGLVQHNIIW